jgi:hypothetical protein
MTTWREMISEEMLDEGETWADVESIVGSEYFDLSFDDGYGRTGGKPFTVWTAKRVYFPVTSDGAEWVASVSRNPDAIATKHIGDG